MAEAVPGSARGLIEQGLRELSLDAPDDAIERVLRYASEIELWNKAYGLVNDSGESLLIRHVLDSLSAVPFLPLSAGARVADIGTGAGLPGIPLAILLPDAFISLVEPMGKRCRFLENQKALLPLPNAEVVMKRAQELSGEWDLITFRALSPLEPGIVSALERVLAPGGRIAAYKGRRDKAEAEISSISGLGLASRIQPLRVPFLDEERHLVLMERKGRA